MTLTAGRLTALCPPQVCSSADAARRMPRIVLAGEARTTPVSGLTGQMARSPASGSRMMPEKKLEAAPFGRPGRTLTVISRTVRPRR